MALIRFDSENPLEDVDKFNSKVQAILKHVCLNGVLSISIPQLIRFSSVGVGAEQSTYCSAVVNSLFQFVESEENKMTKIVLATSNRKLIEELAGVFKDKQNEQGDIKVEVRSTHIKQVNGQVKKQAQETGNLKPKIIEETHDSKTVEQPFKFNEDEVADNQDLRTKERETSKGKELEDEQERKGIAEANETEQKRLADESEAERQRIADEEEKKRQQEEAEAAEQKRIADEEEERRLQAEIDEALKRAEDTTNLAEEVIEETENNDQGTPQEPQEDEKPSEDPETASQSQVPEGDQSEATEATMEENAGEPENGAEQAGKKSKKKKGKK